jgi:hypothetical protein
MREQQGAVSNDPLQEEGLDLDDDEAPRTETTVRAHLRTIIPNHEITNKDDDDIFERDCPDTAVKNMGLIIDSKSQRYRIQTCNFY